MSFLPSADLPVKLTRQFSFSILYRSSHLYRAGMQESVWFWNDVSMALLEHGRAVYTCNDILSWTWPSRQRPPSDDDDDDEVDGNDDDIVDLPGNRATSEWGSLQSGQLHETWPILNSFLSDNIHRFDCFLCWAFPVQLFSDYLYFPIGWMLVPEQSCLSCNPFIPWQRLHWDPFATLVLRSQMELRAWICPGWSIGGGPRDL